MGSKITGSIPGHQYLHVEDELVTDDGALSYLMETLHFTEENHTEKKRKLKRGKKKKTTSGKMKKSHQN